MLPGFATPAGAPEHPITQDLPAKTNAVVQCSIQGTCLDSNLRIAGASHPDAAADQDAGNVRFAILGPGPTSHSSASILYFCAASQGAYRFPGRFQDCALKCSMRPANLSLADRRFSSCGTAARRLRSSAATRGHPSSNKPI